MVKTCSTLGCTNRSIKSKRLSFHKFPLENEALLNQWLVAIKRCDFTPSKYAVICGEHFTSDCFIPTFTGYGLLKDGVVPSLFNFPKRSEKKTTKTARSVDSSHAPAKETIPVALKSLACAEECIPTLRSARLRHAEEKCIHDLHQFTMLMPTEEHTLDQNTSTVRRPRKQSFSHLQKSPTLISTENGIPDQKKSIIGRPRKRYSSPQNSLNRRSPEGGIPDQTNCPQLRLKEEYILSTQESPRLIDEFILDLQQPPGIKEEFVTDLQVPPSIKEEFIIDLQVPPSIQEEFIIDLQEPPSIKEEFITDLQEPPNFIREFVSRLENFPSVTECHAVVDKLPVHKPTLKEYMSSLKKSRWPAEECILGLQTSSFPVVECTQSFDRPVPATASVVCSECERVYATEKQHHYPQCVVVLKQKLEKQMSVNQVLRKKIKSVVGQVSKQNKNIEILKDVIKQLKYENATAGQKGDINLESYVQLYHNYCH